MEEYLEEAEEKKGFFGWLGSVFKGKGEEEVQGQPKYKRRLLDGRIEKYLDKNMDAYIQEYGILTGIDLEAYEMRYSSLTSRISSMKEYMMDADALVSSMENELAKVQTASKKK